VKRISSILILLLSLGIKNIHAESECIFSPQQFSVLNKLKGCVIQNLPISHACTVDMGDSNDNPYSKKRKRGKKAILQTLISSAGTFFLKIVSFEIELVYSPALFYFFQPDFAHGERGPPVSFLAS